MNSRNWMGAVIGAVLLAIGQVASADEPAAAAPAQPAAAATEAAPVQATPATDAAQGTGTVIFFRPSKFMGAAVGFKVREGLTELGKLRSGTYFVVHVTPGTHEYTVHSESKDVLTMEVEAGETYYVQGSIGMGIMAGRPNIAPSNAAAFEAIKAKLKDSGAQKDDKD